jgi:hypothetical protein
MLNPSLHKVGNSFGGNINYPAQSLNEVQNTVVEAVSTAPVLILGEKQGNEICDESNKASENLYFCHHLIGGASHPGIVVETPGLANIKPPRPVYHPCLPVELVTNGKISQIQLERIIYAGQAHGQRLPESAARAGISIGDGTGVGKTGTILGIILDNWFSGRKRTVWFSVKFDLIKAIKDEMATCLKTDKGRKFWHRISQEYRVHAFLTVPRQVFYKYGTTFQTVAVSVSKPQIINQPNQPKPQIVESGNLSEMLRFLDDFAGSES